jgi:hypothetical protein
MAFVFQQQYERYIEERMQGFWQTLSEKDQRRFAALEAARLGRGGVQYIAGVLNCSTRTIVRGTVELKLLPEDPAKGRVRREGAGRKKKSTPILNWSKI